MNKCIFCHLKTLVGCVALLSLLSIQKLEAQNFVPLQTAQQDSTSTLNEAQPVRISTARTRKQQENNSNDRGITVRAKNNARLLQPKTAQTPWKRIIYRELSLDSLSNAPLYYPPRATNKEQNLFTTLFQLLNKNQVVGYEYEDLGYENFDSEHQLKFNEFLDRFGIMYTVQQGAANERYNVLLADIPSEAVKSFYIKEQHFFDPITSTIDVIVLAICPVVHDNVELEGTLKIPLFWVEYNDVKSFLSQRYVMLSDLNNAATATWDDFFRLNLYKGEIVKTQNMLGKSIEQYATTPEEIQVERQRIESQLKKFKEHLYGTENSSKEEKESISFEEEKTKNDETELKTARARRATNLESPSSEKKSTTNNSHPSKVKTSTAKRSVRNRF